MTSLDRHTVKVIRKCTTYFSHLFPSYRSTEVIEIRQELQSQIETATFLLANTVLMLTIPFRQEFFMLL